MKYKKAVFFDRDGVINVEKNFILSPEQMELIEGASEAVRNINESDFLAVLFTNQSAVARNILTINELEKIHQKMKIDLEQTGASFDAIYFCPHHPGLNMKGVNPDFIMDCECRKPKPGMLLQAAKDLDIDLAKSFVIGDADRDIQAGKDAGCTTIGVRTGKNIETFDIQPDYIFDNVLRAVRFILRQ
ncbi:MAG: D-glycero-beta-D-manno-heptose 1,7-bisphosphate 7-phosphatase [Bacteroidales bacterium]